jgi:hypothetical protein
MALPRIYCVDASSLIAMKRVYPRKSLGALWELIEKLVDDGRLIAPHEVLREVGKVEDDLKDWAKKRAAIFVPIDNEQGDALKQIQRSFPTINDAAKEGPHADPWCVALSLVRMRKGEDIWLINEEKQTITRSEKIPYVCDHFKIQWERILQVPALEGLEFTLK